MGCFFLLEWSRLLFLSLYFRNRIFIALFYCSSAAAVIRRRRAGIYDTKLADVYSFFKSEVNGIDGAAFKPQKGPFIGLRALFCNDNIVRYVVFEV